MFVSPGVPAAILAPHGAPQPHDETRKGLRKRRECRPRDILFDPECPVPRQSRQSREGKGFARLGLLPTDIVFFRSGLVPQPLVHIKSWLLTRHLQNRTAAAQSAYRHTAYLSEQLHYGPQQMNLSWHPLRAVHASCSSNALQRDARISARKVSGQCATLVTEDNMFNKSLSDDAHGVERLLSVNDVAQRWAVSRSTVTRVLDAAGVSAVYLSGARRGVRRYRVSDIRAFETRAAR